MSINWQRLANALDVFNGGKPNCLEFKIQEVLEADDNFRAARPNAQAEPKLPDSIKQDRCGGYILEPGNEPRNAGRILLISFEADELRAIADHMDWKARKAAEPVVTPAMVNAATAAWNSC